jgi:hypothetical protein
VSGWENAEGLLAAADRSGQAAAERQRHAEDAWAAVALAAAALVRELVLEDYRRPALHVVSSRH